LWLFFFSERGSDLAEANDKPRPFDVATIRYLVRLMSRHDLSEIDLSEGEQRIRLRRGSRVALPGPAALVQPTAAAAPAAPQPAPAAAAPEKPAQKLLEIKSPAVGTFYAQKEPGAPPFVTAGSRVTPATIVCMIEAMKVFNEIPAECSGVIREVCVQNKDFVEYGTVLFRVDPAG
jgi:acetyl-CoA carboxylase biotin carboxyl carrier protein